MDVIIWFFICFQIILSFFCRFLLFFFIFSLLLFLLFFILSLYYWAFFSDVIWKNKNEPFSLYFFNVLFLSFYYFTFTLDLDYLVFFGFFSFSLYYDLDLNYWIFWGVFLIFKVVLPLLMRRSRGMKKKKKK